MTKARDLANSAAAFAAVSATELGFVDGVTSAIQTQMDAKAPSSTAVTLTDTQTLTNKTLTSPVIASVINNTLTSTTGDVIYASAANTPARRAIGTTGQVLTVSGGVPDWATPAGGGKVLQVKNFVYGTQTSSTSGTFADTGVTLSITPTLNTSKVLVLVNMQGVGRNSTNSSGVYLKLLRGATVIQQMGDTNGFTNGSSWTFDSVGSTYLDSPATTSATTYKVQFAQVSPVAGTVYVQEYQSVVGSAESSITLMEIGA